MGDELGSPTDIDRLPASSGLSTAVSTLIGKDDFGAVIQADFSPKCRQKMVIWSFLGYLGEIESDSQTGPAYALRINIVPPFVLRIFNS